MVHRLAIAQKVTHKTDLLLIIGYRSTHSQSGLAIAFVITWELASHSKQQVLVKAKGYVLLFFVITRAITRPFTCRAIGWPIARLAFATFYVYGLWTMSGQHFEFFTSVKWKVLPFDHVSIIFSKDPMASLLKSPWAGILYYFPYTQQNSCSSSHNIAQWLHVDYHYDDVVPTL